MIKRHYRVESDDTWQLLARGRQLHLAGQDDEGRPVLRCLDYACLDGALVFHGSPKGEKTTLQPQVVAAVHERIAEIPSHFVHPELACPATTYYRSAMVHGRLERMEAPADKARALEALMQSRGYEGSYRPICAEDRDYAREMRGVVAWRIVPERVVGKFKLGQNRKPPEIASVLEGLWRRGGPGDLYAIDLVRSAHPDPIDVDFLRAPAGLRFRVAPTPEDAPVVAALLEGQYWVEPGDVEGLPDVHLRSTAWVVAEDPGGTVVASARAVSDRHRFAWVLDVVVAPSYRGRGVGAAIMKLLLDHPALREVRRVGLGTRDAHAFYERLGFVAHAHDPRRMLCERPA